MRSVDTENLNTHQAGRVAELPLGTLALVLITIACGIAQTFDSSHRIANLLGFRFISVSQLFEQPLAEILLAIIQSVTHVFPHGGWWHLIPNTTALFVFGSMAEQRFGALRLMALYFISGIVGIICHAIVPPLPAEPVAGASLAISGLLGAYCALSCNDRVRSPAARRTLAVIELVAALRVGAWTTTREIPLERDWVTSMLYHLLPMMVMWLLARCFVGASKVRKRARCSSKPSITLGKQSRDGLH